LEENSVIGGCGAAILEWAANAHPGSDTRIITMGLPDSFIEHATRQELLAGLGLQGELICQRLLRELDRRALKRRAQSAS
jgi:1-deoxy-D-xylulose-5-phosphate synthase